MLLFGGSYFLMVEIWTIFFFLFFVVCFGFREFRGYFLGFFEISSYLICLISFFEFCAVIS